MKSAAGPCSPTSWTPAARSAWGKLKGSGGGRLYVVIGHDRQRVMDTYKNDPDINLGCAE